MQDKSFLSPASFLARQQKRKRQALLSTSIFNEFQAIFRAARAGATLLECVPYLVQVLFHHWVLQIVHRVFRFPLFNWQSEEDGVMGGHTRRSKQSVKASSTVICDCATTLEDWKQQIKVKDSIPANQQRLTFTSQRTVKQNFALAKLIPSRQWQILIDASIEDVCKDLKHWRATLRSKNSSAELLQPLVLRETDDLASFLHSRTAKELREIGVPCCVFFLSFKEWIPTLPTKELSPSDREPRGLDLKVDEEFRDNLFFIDLYGDINGLPTPVPLRYVMNGSQLATKLFMVEQTAQYREDQKQRYQHQLAPALKDSNVENSEGSLEVNCQSSCSTDYVLEIEQNCEFTAFISRDHHRLRCIVLPVITIPLVDTKGSEEHPYVYLLNGDVKEGFREASSNVLALPSTSEIKETSTITASSIDQEVHSNATADIPSRKNTKKKKKKKAKKAAKGAHSGQDATVEAEISSCLEPSMKHSHEEAAKDADYCLDDASKKEVEDDSQLLVGKKLKPGRTSPHRDPKDVSLAEVENKVTASKQRGFSIHVGQQQACHPTLAPSNSVSSTRHEHIKEKETGCTSDLDGHVIDGKKEPEFATGTGISDEMVRGDDASMHTEMASGSNPNTALHDHSDEHGNLGPRVLDPVQPASSSGCNSGSHSISKLAGTKKHKESARSSKFSAQTQSSLHRDYLGDYSTNSSDFQGSYAGSHTRLHQQSFWGHRAVEGQDYFPHNKSRTNQNIYTGVVPDDSRSSVPFWRHQRDGIPATSHSWSKPRALRADDGRRFPSSSTFQQFRNLPAWEQLPNLRQPTNGSQVPLHWESHAPSDRPWSSSSRGQSYTSFNMQQRKFGKSNKFSQKFSDRWQPQGMPNEGVALNPKLSNASPNTFIVSSNTKAESFPTTQTCFKGFANEDTSNIVQGSVPSMNLEREMETTCESLAREALDPNIVQTTSSIVNSLSDDGWLNDHDKCGRQSSNSQMAERVCEILDAVNASYESWGAYEQASRLNGKALCEFERVAKAVAPTIQASTSTQSCESTGCLCEALASNSRQIPDVRLNALWQWYEEPSSYGLKVKLSESSKRTGSNLQAFFVPYLSAVQLFGWSRKKKTTIGKDMAVAQAGSRFEFDFLSQPIISILLPRPEANDDSRNSEGLTNNSEGLTKQAKTSSEGVDSGRWADFGSLSSSSRQCHCDVELLYEFFEVEKPQQRKPLTDRVKELVSKSDGDVHVLENAKIEDLHPSSWFAVAWYPIYKIPDETFRAAFLTYHCLRCLQSTCSGSANTNDCMESCMHTITAPVVGLMSYNAQVKDWFSLSPSCGGSPDNVLQQYLTKLEISATCMARGSCEKSSSFKHGDFTFFQSRGR